jgi:hypothetical protein
MASLNFIGWQWFYTERGRDIGRGHTQHDLMTSPSKIKKKTVTTKTARLN